MDIFNYFSIKENALLSTFSVCQKFHIWKFLEIFENGKIFANTALELGFWLHIVNLKVYL